MPVEEAVRYMKEAARKTYAKKGEKVVSMNLAAVDAAVRSNFLLVLDRACLLYMGGPLSRW